MLEGEKIAPAVVLNLQQLELGLVELVEEIVEDEEGVVAGIDMADHEGRQLVFLARRAAIEKYESAGLEQGIEFPQHPLIVGQVLDHAHDDDGVEFLLGLVVIEIGELDVELVAEIGELGAKIGLRHLGIGDAGEAHAGLQRVAGEGPPAWPDLEHALAGSELAFVDGPVELPLQRP